MDSPAEVTIGWRRMALLRSGGPGSPLVHRVEDAHITAQCQMITHVRNLTFLGSIAVRQPLAIWISFFCQPTSADSLLKYQLVITFRHFKALSMRLSATSGVVMQSPQCTRRPIRTRSPCSKPVAATAPAD